MENISLIEDCQDVGRDNHEDGMRVRMMKIIINMTTMIMSVDLFDHCILSVFCPILPYVQDAAVGPEKIKTKHFSDSASPGDTFRS